MPAGRPWLADSLALNAARPYQIRGYGMPVLRRFFHLVRAHRERFVTTFEANRDESHSTPVLQVRLKSREKRDKEGVHSRRVMYLVDDWGRSTNLQICNDISSEIRKCTMIPTTRSWLPAWLIRLLESVWGELEDGCCWSAMHARQALR